MIGMWIPERGGFCSPLVNDHIAGWNIPIFNRTYIFISGPFFIAMLEGSLFFFSFETSWMRAFSLYGLRDCIFFAQIFST